MKLTRLHIKNFRGINGEDNVIEFNDSNIIFLIGKNNATKSTFLHAYEQFTSKKKAEKEDFYDYKEENNIEIVGEFLKEAEDDENKDFNKEPDWIKKWVDKRGIVKIKKVWDQIGGVFKKYTLDPNTDKFVVGGFGGFDSLFTKYTPTPIFINAIESEDSFEKKVNEIIDKEFLKRINSGVFIKLCQQQFR
jgi:recombinational DNA repair ATPase RecF